MADKGFTIRDILSKGILLNIPSFLVNGQITLEEVNNKRLISSSRIHVKRFIQRLKLFAILHQIPYQFRQKIHKILKVCVSYKFTNTHSPWNSMNELELQQLVALHE